MSRTIRDLAGLLGAYALSMFLAGYVEEGHAIAIACSLGWIVSRVTYSDGQTTAERATSEEISNIGTSETTTNGTNKESQP